MGHLQISRLIPAPTEDVFRHITELRNLPDWLGPASFSSLQVDFPSSLPQAKERAEFEAIFVRYGMSVRIVARVDEYEPYRRFSYHQVSGLFRSWSHTQVLTTHDEKTTLVTDLVDFRLPYGLFGALADDLFIRNDLMKILTHRLIRIEDHFRDPHRYHPE